MKDVMERLGRSLIQHGPLSRRVYVMKVAGEDLPGLVERVDALAAEKGYTKIFAKVPAPLAHAFVARGYETEATVPAFYDATVDGLFMARYPDAERRRSAPRERIDEVLEIALARAVDPARCAVEPPLRLARLETRHASACAAVYREVFESYPFPIHEADYVAETMASHIAYFGVFDGEELVAVASAEMDREGRNVEMTDFATLSSHRGRSLATALLHHMEKACAADGMRCAFTIARALSPSMNVTFARMGYVYDGTLYNNTHIGGALESMNVWHKALRAPQPANTSS